MALLPFMLSLIAFFLNPHNGVHCYGDKQLLNLQRHFQWNHNSDTLASPCLSRKEKGATILEMKHRDYCYGGRHKDWNKLLNKRLILDDLRVRSLQTRIKKTMSPAEKQDVSVARIPLTSGVELGTLNYIVTVEIGSRKMTVIVDTGSDLTWVQCQPCKSCYGQKEPIFNPSASPSYRTVSCNSSECQSLAFATGNTGICGENPPTCNYVVSYGDGSYTRGDLAHDRINLGKTPVENFIFGCGRNNKGLFGGASGLLGLGRSSISLVSQTWAIFGGFFSYCLPSTESGASGSLVLGGSSSVYNTSNPFSYTRMIPNPKLSTFYFLNLTGVGVGGVTLRDSSIGKTTMLIDSGTVITRLPPTLYKALKTEFQKQFSGFPTAPAFSILDTCFNLSAYQEVDVPTLKLQFEGNAEMNVDVTGVFYFVKTDASQVCLALASLTFEDEIGIIANYQQRNQRVIYDTKGSRLGFAQESCSFS
ncbi:aspartyl protease family protein At5g10770-like isoform X2 [Hibiscus syriacus]|uniref:aspartyl protease family protein At5g10770-like isoform X2 n=1 Tax=Hibiscus syriacus TaxID=106335 RepID=UPI001923A00B|nr:aspartyl protease family protein At5g10770-like isoform X2 [Hibiscus syriacus]